MKKNNNKNKRSKKILNRHERNKEKYKLSTIERAQFADMNQIEWFPVDPYCD